MFLLSGLEMLEWEIQGGGGGGEEEEGGEKKGGGRRRRRRRRSGSGSGNGAIVERDAVDVKCEIEIALSGSTY